MSALLTSLPGEIPGLLRRASPVVIADAFRGVVVEDPSGCSSTLVTVERDEDTMGLRLEMLHALALDLSDPTGRAHAAWWVGNHPDWMTLFGSIAEDMDAVSAATCGMDMPPEHVDLLARLCMRLAGRTP